MLSRQPAMTTHHATSCLVPYIRLFAIVALWLLASGAWSQNNPLTPGQKATLGIIQILILGNSAPQVSITAPAPGATLGTQGATTVSAIASDEDGTVTQVEFFANGVLIGTSSTAPHTTIWIPAVDGSYSLTARATDNDNDSTTSAPVNVTVVANTPPSVTLTSPAPNSSHAAGSNISLVAAASDTGGIARVEFYRGATLVATRTSAPYTATDSNVPAGTHSYTARAYDNYNAANTSAAAAVNVFSVALTAPAQNQNFAAPANITLTAAPSAGSPQSVEFLQGNTVIHTSTSAPYTFTWASLPPGNYSFTARATDAGGGATTSTAIHVTVGTAAQQAQLYFIHPDHLNTPRVITNNAQQVVWRWDNTDPFGANAPNENPSGLGGFTCNLRLPGQYFDRETNLHYNYFRDYDPAIGRYVQSDPIGLYGGINTYAYVGGNPLNNSDPMGLQVFGGGISSGAGGGFGGLGGFGGKAGGTGGKRDDGSFGGMFPPGTMMSGGSNSGKDDGLTPEQLINYGARKEYGDACPPDSNCVWAKPPDLNPSFVPTGWILCHYRCRTSSSQVLSRYMPIELGCPQPVAVAPGIYSGNPPPPRGAGTPMPFTKIPFQGFMP